MTGVPQVVSAQTSAPPDDSAAVRDVRPKAVNVGSLFERSLLYFESPVTALWVPSLCRFYASTDGTDSAALLWAWNADTGGKIILQPRAGQSGQLLLWEEVSNSLDSALTGLLTNDYQKRSAWSTLQAGMSQYEPTAAWVCAAMLDQVNGRVGLSLLTGGCAAAMSMFVPTGQTVCLEMEQHGIKPIFE